VKNLKKGFTLLHLIIVIGVFFVVGIGYFILHRDSGTKNESILKPNTTPEENLQIMEEDLISARASLAMLQEGFMFDRPVNKSFNSNCLKLLSVVRKTDTFFTLNVKPEFKVKTDAAAVAAINSQRTQIETKLTNIKSRCGISSRKQLTLDILIELKNDALFIQAYIKALTKIIDSLTVAKSGLSQFQINSYQNIIITSDEEIGSIITAITDAIPTTQSNEVVIAHQVTEQHIETQENIVQGLEAQIASLQEQIAQFQNTGQPDDTSETPTVPGNDDNNNTGDVQFLPGTTETQYTRPQLLQGSSPKSQSNF